VFCKLVNLLNIHYEYTWSGHIKTKQMSRECGTHVRDEEYVHILNCEMVWGEHTAYLVDLDADSKVLLKCVLKKLRVCEYGLDSSYVVCNTVAGPREHGNAP